MISNGSAAGVHRARGEMQVLGVAGRQNGMKIVLYGATGNAGSRILTELLARGHEVVAVSRDPSKLVS